MSKIENDSYYMNYALKLSTTANCIKGKVGAILVKDNEIEKVISYMRER